MTYSRSFYHLSVSFLWTKKVKGNFSPGLTSSIRIQVPSSDRAINKFRLCLRSYRQNDERAPVKPLSGIVLLKESHATLLLVVH